MGWFLDYRGCGGVCLMMVVVLFAIQNLGKFGGALGSFGIFPIKALKERDCQFFFSKNEKGAFIL